MPVNTSLPTPPAPRLPWCQLMLLGLVAAVITLAGGLWNGLRQGFDRGIQALETGQVEIVSDTGAIVPYFMVKSLADQVTGVAATSARLDFVAQMTNDRGESLDVPIRAVNFAQESKVTGLSSRISPSAGGAGAGLVLSYQLSRLRPWADSASILMVSGGQMTRLPLSGILGVPSATALDRLCYIDLDTARQWLGASVPVSSIVVRLKDGVVPDRWVADHQETFRRYDLSLRTWNQVATTHFPSRQEVLGPLDVALALVGGLAAVGWGLFAWKSRRPRSGLSMVLVSSGREKALALAAFVAAYGLVLGLALVLGALVGPGRWLLPPAYPWAGGSALPFSPGVALWLVPLTTVVATVVLVRWPWDRWTGGRSQILGS